MNIGSHNTLTYRRPKKWWMRPFHFMTQCQDKDYTEQYNLGARVFDLRVTFDKAGAVEVRHGVMHFDVTSQYLKEFLEFLNNKADCYLRVILEFNKAPKDLDYQQSMFNEFCIWLEETYTHIKFFGGNRKYDWALVHQFYNEDEPVLIDKYSSTTSLFNSDNKLLRIIDDLYPKFYAKLKNKQNFNNFDATSTAYLFVDFLEIR
jgi:hypothetical protein